MNLLKIKKGRQHLYLLWSPFNGIWKVGISTNFQNRLNTIRESTDETIIPIFQVKTSNAKKIEQRILRHFKPWRITWKGSGKTEWLRMPFFVTPFLLIEFIWLKFMWLIILLGIGMIAISEGFINIDLFNL